MTVQHNTFSLNVAETHGGGLFQTTHTNEASVAGAHLRISNNSFTECTASCGAAMLLRTASKQTLEISGNVLTLNDANSGSGSGLVIVQMTPLADESELADINGTNEFTDNSGSDLLSYPHAFYLRSESEATYDVSPGIATTLRYGALDLFGSDFESFAVSDWMSSSTNFVFWLDVRNAEIVTINEGSLSAGKCNISLGVPAAERNGSVVTTLSSKLQSLLAPLSVGWAMTGCPAGYGYDAAARTCSLCASGSLKQEHSWSACADCLDGLDCRGGDNVHIEAAKWWTAPAANESGVAEAFSCRLGDCCVLDDGCDTDSAARCPSDRDPESVGCGACAEGLSAMHGSSECGDCQHLGDAFSVGAIFAFVLWPLFLLLTFGLTLTRGKYGDFSVLSVMQMSALMLVDFYQSLPAAMTFAPDAGTALLTNVLFARIPSTQRGLCLLDGMTVRDEWLWSLLMPSLLLCLAALSLALWLLLGLSTLRLRGHIAYDPLRAFLVALLFVTTPMLWSAAHLLTCVDYGGARVFWNAPAQTCSEGVVAAMALLLLALVALYAASNAYVSHRFLLHHEDVTRDRTRLPLYLQRLQPFFLMVYPVQDISPSSSKIEAGAGARESDRELEASKGSSWQTTVFRPRHECKYLYVGWAAPFVRKLVCVLVHATTTGADGPSHQTFLVALATLVTLMLYQMFSEDYTSRKDFSLQLYCAYLLVWLCLLALTASTKIVTRDVDGEYAFVQGMVRVILWIPFVGCVGLCAFVLLLWRHPKAWDDWFRYQKGRLQEYRTRKVKKVAVPETDADTDYMTTPDAGGRNLSAFVSPTAADAAGETGEPLEE